MKKLLLIYIMSMVSWSGYAHAPNEAFFEVFESDSKLVIKAEFPWTIRKALLKAMPELAEATTKAQMDAGLLAYLQKNIQVTDLHNQTFQLQRVQELPPNGHGHGSEFLLIYGPYKVVQSIRNSCLFESYPDQKNFHTVDLPNRDPIEFALTAQQPFFTQATSNSQVINTWIFVVLAILAALAALLFFFKRKATT